MVELAGFEFSQSDEDKRLNTVERYKTASSPSEHSLKDFAELACQIFDLDGCLIALIGQKEIIFRANIGFSKENSEPRSNSLIGRLLPAETVSIIVQDSQDINFSQLDTSHIRFFAGVPLISPDGDNIGTLWMINHAPVRFNQKKQGLLAKFAKVVMDRMGLWLVAAEEISLKENNKKLASAHEKAVEKMSHLIAYQEEIAHANVVLEKVLDSFEMIFLKAPMAMGICAAAHKNLWQANEALTRLFGTETMVLGERLDNLIQDIDGQDFMRLLEEVRLQRKPYQAKEAKLLIRHGDGQRHIFANLSLQPVGRMGDEHENIMFIIDDVSDQVFLRQVAQEANEVLINAIGDADLGYTVVEFSTGKMSSNARLKRNYGFLADQEFTYPDLFEAMLPQYRDPIKQAVQKAISNKSIYQAEYQVRWPDGSVHWVRGYGKPMYDANGNATHIIGLNKLIDSTHHS
ncbi:hypothetical protein ASE74_04245 [Pedobacter sp. Leaf216]|uniref:PAS domain-containing protein n=1 Tax=Pedobacter sp. Leaf216 TaxID=1735684 RepID=UPI0007022B70|nr:PAS domain-containing protein [Pedobacter sp. Leaf216]KQM69230.1 hypothetical protein ASE74_04245 [Pedobacter sp. Leaf216]